METFLFKAPYRCQIRIIGMNANHNDLKFIFLLRTQFFTTPFISNEAKNLNWLPLQTEEWLQFSL